MAQINHPRLRLVKCPHDGCEWSKRLPREKAEKSLEGHVGYAHRQGQSAKVRRTESVNSRGERVMNYGKTKRSRENSLRLSDGQEHPVTVRFTQDPAGGGADSQANRPRRDGRGS